MQFFLKWLFVAAVSVIFCLNSAQADLYTVTEGGDGKAVRVYDTQKNTTTFTYTMTGNGDGSASNRLKAFSIAIPDCPERLQVVGFAPDLADGDRPPFSPVNPVVFQDSKDKLLGMYGIRWHGWHGGSAPAVLLEPDASRVFSVTFAGNVAGGVNTIGLWHWEGKHWVTPVHDLEGPSCDSVQPTPTATPTPEPSTTPTAIPTPTPEPGCALYSLTRKVRGRIPGKVWSIESKELLTEEGEALACIDEIYKAREEFCLSNEAVRKHDIFNKPLGRYMRVKWRNRWRRARWIDNSILKDAGGPLCFKLSPVYLNLGAQACEDEPKSKLCGQYKSLHKIIGWDWRRNHPRWETLYFDGQCNLEFSPSEAKQETACPAAMVEVSFTGSSPISLIWEPGHSVESGAYSSRFPLEPGVQGARYQWKASAKAPLLVFDPEHTGNITQARQLFGDWALGGQRLAYAGTVWSMASWDNGYEALATLDYDGNGQIDGAEIEPLGLWFDENRDGISQQGEVKPLRNTGVTKLFFKDPVFDELTYSHSLAIGYERVVNGRTEKLPSVDWRAMQVK